MDIMEEHEELKRNLVMYQNMLMQTNNTYPVDYIINMPDIFKDMK